MFIDFEKLPDSSKIWIYQSNRKFYKNEAPEIHKKTQEFLDVWFDGDREITASFEIKYNRFIIIAVDQSKDSLSIEAIDKSVSFILSLQADYQIELLDKLNVSFKQGEFVQYKELKDFQKLIKAKAINENTIVFNNLINTKKEFESDWEITLKESWHNRFL